jgi:hypothetical protein
MFFASAKREKAESCSASKIIGSYPKFVWLFPVKIAEKSIKTPCN